LIDFFRGSRLFDAKTSQLGSHGSNEMFRICHGLILPAIINDAVMKSTLFLLLCCAAYAQAVSEPGVAYAQADPQQVMDIVRPKEAGKHPAILAIHGGGFRGGSRKGYQAICTTLAERGYVCATADYRLAPAAPFPAAVYDVKSAVRYLRANASRLGIDPAKIGVMGGSAGGHLALFLGVTGNVPEFEGDGPNRDQSSRVSVVVDYYGPSDLTKSYGRSVDAAEVLPLFLGGDLAHARAMHLRASPLNWVTPDAAPTLAIQGTKDRS
jgi:acetyl esterase/lipase